MPTPPHPPIRCVEGDVRIGLPAPVNVATMPEPFNTGSKARHGKKLPAGNEGAGSVVATGDSDMAKALIGQRVACVPGNAYSQYCLADAANRQGFGHD